MRKYNETSDLYELDQKVLLGQLQNVSGYAQLSNLLHHNDRLRLFGVIMTLPHNLAIYERLSEGIKNRAMFDDPKMQLEKLFTKVANDFNNDDYIIEMPRNAEDVEGWETMDPNDHTRIRIYRDCKCIVWLWTYTYFFFIWHIVINSSSS